MTTLLITGASGLVGSALLQMFKREFDVLGPTHSELDITDTHQVSDYIAKHKPAVIIHAAAFTDADKAERERGNKQGKCWRVNVLGTRNLSRVAKKTGSYVIYVSTGSVFSGSSKRPGPFKENDPAPSRSSHFSWYGWTKNRAEGFIDGAIIRLSHPILPKGLSSRRDYLQKMMDLYFEGKLYPVFTDQLFPISFIGDVYQSIRILIASEDQGVFHVASPDLVNPYELLSYALKNPSLQRQTIDSFLQTHPTPRRFTKYAAIDVRETQDRLGVLFTPWKKAVDRVLSTNSSRG